MSQQFTHFLDDAFQDERLSKLDIEILWRINCSSRKMAKSQSVLRYWTGRSKSSVADSLKRLCEADYLAKVGSSYVLADLYVTDDCFEEPNESVRSTGQKVRSTGQKVRSTGQKVRSTGFDTSIYKKQERTEKDTHPLEIHFLPLTDEIISDSRYVSLQRRPLKKYPLLWMSVPELAAVLPKYEKELSKQQRAECFQRAELDYHAAVQTKKQPKDRIAAVNWLLSHILTDKLKEVRELGYSKSQKERSGESRPRPKAFKPAWEKSEEAA